MPYMKRRAIGIPDPHGGGIFVLFVALILLMTRPAWPADQIPCWKAKALLAYAGTQAEAEKIAQQHGYTRFKSPKSGTAAGSNYTNTLTHSASDRLAEPPFQTSAAVAAGRTFKETVDVYWWNGANFRPA
jgi:ABC-type uncharacterized transport system YnjBCD substrate-binding protein